MLVSKHLDLGLEPGDLKSRRLRFLVQRISHRSAAITETSSDSSTSDDQGISIGIAEGRSTITLIYNCAQYPVQTSVEK
ncbi:hypothetical protein GWK47_017498 [Chionoecetes opilio]|uniref:Uncharacterized protein n=1 Tax=Chionoecetes opilio TaxID=41210 RepID=A0A8J4XTQ8_CHIOP|nr:hypothetical protein GWK47_017498 [Chionoecetes opilio]